MSCFNTVLKDTAKKTVDLLARKRMKIATAESCTGGLVAKLITDISGSSNVFDFGIVSYSNDIKHSILGVSNETLCSFGAVSEETVREMAQGVKNIANANISVAISGIAGPLSDDTNKPVGLIWIAVCCDDEIITKKLNNNYSENIRENNRNEAAKQALELVCQVLEKQKAGE